MRGQATLTVRSRFKNFTRVKFRRHENIGECASTCDQRHACRSERSPLHDVRQHARVVPYGSAAREFCFSRTSNLRSTGSPHWWSQTGSNRRPPACKAGALPTELWPRRYGSQPKRDLVGLGRFELPTSRLSSARSNQLSYRPVTGISYQMSAIRKVLITDY